VDQVVAQDEALHKEPRFRDANLSGLIDVIKQRVVDSFYDRLFQRLLANAGWLLTSDVVASGLGFTQTIILARVLGVEQFGVFALIQTYSTTVNQFVDSRVWEAVVKFVTKFLEAQQATRATAFVKLSYLIDAITGALAYFIALGTAEIAARYIVKQPQAAGLIRLYALTILVATPLGTSTGLLKVFNRFDWIAYQNVVGGLFRLTGVVVAWSVEGGLRAIVWAYVLSAFLMTAGTLILSQRASRAALTIPWRQAPVNSLKGERKEVAKFLLSTNGNALCKLLQRNADILLIGYFLTPVAVACFRIARALTDMMAFPVNPLETACYPEFVRLWHQEKKAELRKLVWKLTFLAGTFAALGLTILCIGGGLVIRLSVGREFLPALSAVRWLALAVAVAVATNFAYPLLLAVGRAPATLLAIGLGVAVQIPLLFKLIPHDGIAGAALAYLIFYGVWVASVFHSARDVVL